jgi:putative serine/threonine protein kinase
LRATQSEQAALEQLTQTPYIRVLTYPKVSLRTARSRVKQLEKLGVESLLFEGRTRIGRLGILGIGTVGLVVKCRVGGQVLALKMRRTDANRPSLDEEFRMTTLANRVGVGAPLHGHTKDLILLKYLDFVELPDWLASIGGEGTRARVREMLHSLLNQCRTLDIMGLDHGELSDLRKHAVVAEERPWILDFESASSNRQPRNVTSAAQYLLIGGRVAPLVRRLLGFKGTNRVLEVLQAYKRDTSDFSYARLLEELGVAGT